MLSWVEWELKNTKVSFIILHYDDHYHYVFEQLGIGVICSSARHTPIHCSRVGNSSWQNVSRKGQCVDPANKSVLTINNAPLGAKVYCFIPLTQQLDLHFNSHNEHVIITAHSRGGHVLNLVCLECHGLFLVLVWRLGTESNSKITCLVSSSRYGQ